MRRTVTRLFAPLAALLLGAVLATPPVVAQGRPDCASIVRAMTKMQKKHGARGIDAQEIADQFDTDSVWVEKCATTYGRRVHSVSKRSADDDDLTAKREEDEYEELAHEEEDQQANAVQEDLRNGVYATTSRGGGTVPDDTMEWEPFITHEWEPYVTHEWTGPYIRDDDDPGFE